MKLNLGQEGGRHDVEVAEVTRADTVVVLCRRLVVHTTQGDGPSYYRHHILPVLLNVLEGYQTELGAAWGYLSCQQCSTTYSVVVLLLSIS